MRCIYESLKIKLWYCITDNVMRIEILLFNKCFEEY